MLSAWKRTMFRLVLPALFCIFPHQLEAGQNEIPQINLSIPTNETQGRFGARASKLYEILKKGHYDVKLSKEDFHCITLWLDCNSDFFGSHENTKAQAKGNTVQPKLE
jgi:hypothetical protein